MARYQELFEPIREYALECWIRDETPTLNGAARSCGEIRRSGDRETYTTPIRTAYTHLQEKGVLIVVKEAEHAKSALLIRGFNYTGRSAESQSLRDALEPYLADGSVSVAARQLVKEALRRVLPLLIPVDLTRSRTDEAVLVAASHLPAERIRELPARARSLPLKKKYEYARAIRNLLRHAFANDSVVVWTRPPRETTPWQVSVDEVLPDPSSGRRTSGERSKRKWLARLRRTLETVDGPKAAPTLSELSVEDANRIIHHIETEEADIRAAREIRAVLTGLGELGHGPYRELSKVRRSVKRVTPRHFAASWVLTPADGGDVAATWDNLLHTLRSHGVSDTELTFYDWLRDYYTLEGLDLESRYGYELLRPDIRHLKGMSYGARVSAVRHYYGVAILDLGWPLAEVNVQTVFGRRFPELTNRLRHLWQERAEIDADLRARGLPARGFAASNDSQTLQRLIINGGLIAAAAYEHSRWSRGLSGIVPEKDSEGKELPIRVTPATIADQDDLTPEERRWLNAYRYANMKADNVQSRRGRKRTHRNVRQIMEDIPTMALMPAALDRLQRRVKRSPHDETIMAEAMNMFIRGIIATGGARVGELPKVRLGTQFQPGDRFIDLTGRLRKRDVDHILVIHPELIPAWLYQYVLEVARPRLVSRWVAAHTAGRDDAPADHGFLCVRRSGAPWADTGWTPRSRDLSPQQGSNASSQILAAFSDWRRRELKRQGFTVVRGGWGHHTTQAERHRIHQAGLNYGFTAEQMGQVLGHEGKTTGQIFYSAAVARDIEHIISTIIECRSWRLGAEGARRRERSDFIAKVLNLKKMADMGKLSADEVLKELRDLEAA